MPRQPQLNGRPYTKLLSALRKQELVRLSTEFRLSSEGSVPALRDRIKGHLNENREQLFRNPRFKALYPRHRRHNQPQPPPSPRPSRTLSTRASSPALSYASWNGILDQEPQQQLPVQPELPPAQPEPIPPPIQPQQPQYTPSITITERGPSPPFNPMDNGCKFHSLPL
jgi:hypothetical protein